MKITVIFNNLKIDLTCFDILSGSFFIKETIDQPNIQEMVLHVNQTICPNIHNLLKYIFSIRVYEILEREVISENETSYQSTYRFNVKGIKYIESFGMENFVNIFLVLDSLDIKSLLVGFMNYLSDKCGYDFKENIISIVRSKRYKIATLYCK